MKKGTLDTMKFLRLRRELGLPRYQVIGLLEGLWYLTASSAPDGSIGRHSNLEIAAWLEWEGNPDEMIEKLLRAGFLDESKDCRLVVHDWEDHCPTYIRGNMTKYHKTFAKGTPKYYPNEYPSDTPNDTPMDACGGGHGAPTYSIPSKSIPSKSSQSKTKAQNFTIPDWIDPNDWMAFEEMRKKIRKPMTDRARANIVKRLEGFRERKLDISVILNNSITAGWQDVYEPKANGNGSYPKSNEEWQAKGKDLGLNPRGGESWNDFIGRVKAKMEAAHG